MKKHVYRSFRPWPENQELLELADKMGFNVSELLNEVVVKHFNEHMKTKVEKLRKALSAPAK